MKQKNYNNRPLSDIEQENKQLKTENKKLTSLLDHLPGDIYWKDLNGVWLGVNNKGLESLKRMKIAKQKSDVIGKTDYELFTKKTADDFRANDLKVIKTKKPFSNEERNTLSDGTIIEQLSVKSPLHDSKGNIIGIMGNTLDITKLKNTEKELKKAKEKAEAANQAKTEFLENMRHDIRTPLTGIVGFSDIIKSEAENPSVKEYADNLVASSHALLSLMDEVLEAVRVSSGEIPGVKKKFSIKNTLQHIIDLNSAKAASKRLDLQFAYDENIPNYVIGDNIRIHRIVLELVSNALNFTDVGFVNIRAELAKKEGSKLVLKLIIKDSGMGIPPERKQEIFLQFKRLTPSYQGIYKGAGLGLSVVKQFIDDIDGEIYVESQPNKGSIFTCVIPLKEPLLADDSGVENEELDDLSADSGAAPQALISEETPKEKPAQYRILVVEDNHIAQKVAQSILSQHDCDTDVAKDGKEALELWKKTPYDLIFMDIGLPDMDGYEVTHHIRVQELSKKSHLPIVALTAHAGEENKERCISAGMNAVITKPLTAKSCKDVLDSFIPSRKQKTDDPTNQYISDLPEHESELLDLSSYKTLDLEEGIKATGSEDMLAKMLEIMISESLLEDIEQMKQAHDSGDWEKTQNLAHKIKGGTVYVGAIKIKMACQYLERYWKTNQQELLEPLYQQVIDTINESIKDITEWLKNRPVDLGS